MGSLVFYISVTCLVYVTLGNPLNCSTEIRGIPPNVKRLNGLWNLKAVIGLHELTKAIYTYSNIRVSEKEARIWGFTNLMTDDGIVGSRMHLEKDSLDYQYEPDAGITGMITFIQTKPDNIIIHLRLKNKPTIFGLFTKGTSVSQDELEEFKRLGECNGVQGYIELNIAAINNAQTCFGVFHASKTLDEMKDGLTSWHLIAKSSRTADLRYNLRILYKARLEITRNGEEYTLREIFTAPDDTIIQELTFTKKGEPGGNKVVDLQTGEDLLLLGVHTKAGVTLYLASKNPTAKQSVINKFNTQALCHETKYTYVIPESIDKDDDAEKCAEKLKQMVPINFRESVGKWILTVSAHDKVETALADVSALYGITEFSVFDNEVHVAHTSIHQGILYVLEKGDIDVDESKGHVLYKDTIEGIRTPVYRVSPDCIMFSPDLLPAKLYLNCRANQIPSVDDITKFVQYASCRKYNSIVLRRHSSSSCSDLPAEVTVLDVDKIAGKWTLTAVASNVPREDVHLPPEIQFVVNDGEVIVTDGNWKSTAVKIQDRRLRYAKGEENMMEMRFHGPLEDSLLVSVGNTEEHKVFLVLFTKSGLVKPGDIKKFKHFAGCLSIPVTFIKE